MLGKQNLQTESNDDYHHPQVSENYFQKLFFLLWPEANVLNFFTIVNDNSRVVRMTVQVVASPTIIVLMIPEAPMIVILMMSRQYL